MVALVSHADRALIDAAIAAGMVQRLPAFMPVPPVPVRMYPETRYPRCRQKRTSQHARAEVRLLRREGWTYDAIAAEVNLSKSQVWRIVNGGEVF